MSKQTPDEVKIELEPIDASEIQVRTKQEILAKRAEYLDLINTERVKQVMGILDDPITEDDTPEDIKRYMDIAYACYWTTYYLMEWMLGVGEWPEVPPGP